MDSSVIDMAEMEGEETSYGAEFADQSAPLFTAPPPAAAGKDPGAESDPDDFQQNMASNMGSFVWQSGSQKARQYLSLYGNIDILRPYFDVEPHVLRKRLIQSLIPRVPTAAPRHAVPRELYGPTMLVFTMIALLLAQMKHSGHTVQEGTLMGTAFGVCFGYWFFASFVAWFLSYVCNTHITMLQILSLMGYALFGHCVVLAVTMVVHTSHDHVFFYLLWGLFGGASTLRMLSILTSRTSGHSQKLVVCSTVAALHLLFLMYLHFAYHRTVEDISDYIGLSLPQQPAVMQLPAQPVIAGADA